MAVSLHSLGLEIIKSVCYMRAQYDCSQRYCGLEGNDPVKSGNWEISTLNIRTEFFP
jgi:hypothetical protein